MTTSADFESLIEQQLQQLAGFGIRPGLERIESLLEFLDNPQQGLSYVHIAGTNGKGSSSLIIATIMTTAGYRVGRFSSPHLHSYCERFNIDGHQIPAETLYNYLQQIETSVKLILAAGGSHPTEFEILTAIAFLYFRDEKVDVAVMEVGMGGLYDSTNVITPLVSIITGIDYDHTAYLGNTLTQIAYNKAGIIKPGVPVVVGPMSEPALDVIRDKANLQGSEVVSGSEIKVSNAQEPNINGQIVNIESQCININGTIYSLLGNYQLYNLATSLAAIEVLCKKTYRIDNNDIIRSISQLKMPGRLEILSKEPLVIIDAAHNPQGARAVADSLQELLPNKQKVLILGILDDKDKDNIISPLGANTKACVMTRPEGLRSSRWEELANAWNGLFPNCKSYEIEDIDLAVSRGLELVEAEDYMLITGSFYVLGKARRFFMNT